MISKHNVGLATPAHDRSAVAHIPTWISQALVAGGAAWIAYYAMWIISGLTSGDAPAMGSGLYIFTNALFAAALVGINAGLAGFAFALRQRTPILGYVALALGLLGVASVTYGFFGRVLLGDRIGFPGGNAVLASCFGATLLGIAAFRSKALPRRETGLLLFIGLLTFPLIVALGMIANLWLPAWATDELPFAMAGALWITFGLLFQRVAQRSR